MYLRLQNLTYHLIIKKLILVLSLNLFLAANFFAQSSDQLKDQRMAIIEKMEATSLIADHTREQIQLIEQEIRAFKDQMEGVKLSAIDENTVDTEYQNRLFDIYTRDSLVVVYDELQDQVAAYLLKQQLLIKDNDYQVAKEAAKKYLLKKQVQKLSLEIDQLNLNIAQEQEKYENEQFAQQTQQSKIDSKKAIIEEYSRMISSTKNYKKELTRSLRQTRNSLETLKRKREEFNVKIEQTIIAELSGKNLRSSAPEYNIYRGKSISNLKGRLESPLADANITRRFGKQSHPSLNSIKVINNGIDLSSKSSNQVTAVAAGKVISIMAIPGFDQLIILQHDDYYTVYSKVDVVLVSLDQQVKSGDTLAQLIAQDGNYELHFEIWKGKLKLNPTKWLRPF